MDMHGHALGIPRNNWVWREKRLWRWESHPCSQQVRARGQDSGSRNVKMTSLVYQLVKPDAYGSDKYQRCFLTALSVPWDAILETGPEASPTCVSFSNFRIYFIQEITIFGTKVLSIEPGTTPIRNNSKVNNDSTTLKTVPLLHQASIFYISTSGILPGNWLKTNL